MSSATVEQLTLELATALMRERTRSPVVAAEAAAGVDDVAFVTIEAVEIAHVGMDWPAASGPVTLTFQHLADAVMAANDDPHILPPRLKLGHTDPRFNEDPAEYDPFNYHGPLREDGNPVYGRVVNLRLAEDGMVLVGDYVEVPQWLGDALPSAYPSRSLEGDFDIETEGGKRYSFVITAVALLGEPLPAISCLEDLVRELTGGPAAVLEQTPVTLSKEDKNMPISAEASTDSVFQQCVDQVCVGDRYWWWPIEMRIDEGWVLVDDDDGHSYRVPFTTDADGNAEFGDPVRGVLDFRELPDTSQEPVAAARPARFSARPHDRVRAATDTNERSSDVDISTLREQLDMPDATDDEVIAAAAERLTSTTDETETTETEAAETVEPVSAEPIAASSAVTVDREQLAQLQRDAKMGREAREAQIAAERAQVVDDAIRCGKFPPARRDHYLTLMSADEHGTRELIARLAENVISLEERGGAHASSDTTNDLGWFAGRELKKETV